MKKKFEIQEADVCGFKYNVRLLHYAPNGNWYYVGFGRFCKTLAEVSEYINELSNIKEECEVAMR